MKTSLSYRRLGSGLRRLSPPALVRRFRGRFPKQAYDPDVTGRVKRLLQRPSDAPQYLYMPWIAGHGDALIRAVEAAPGACGFIPFPIFGKIDIQKSRHQINRFSRRQPDVYRELILRSLQPLRGLFAGFVFTFDWSPTMRLVSDVCQELQIPRVLIPHESVFMNRDLYYTDTSTLVNTPAADIVLCWGELQREIFTERGYPAERLKVVGTPKFDKPAAFKTQITRQDFCNAYGLDATRKTLLFATQPMDLQVDTKVLLRAQQRAISDLLSYAETRNWNLVVRLPPSQQSVTSPLLRGRIRASPYASLDGEHEYRFSSQESIHHTDVTVSFNSTMLFEAGLMGRPAVTVSYAEFEQLWVPLQLPSATDQASLWSALDDIDHQTGANFSTEGWAWARRNFSAGTFDGKAAERINLALRATPATEATPSALTKLLSDHPSPPRTIGLAHLDRLQDTQQHLGALLQARHLIAINDVQTAYAAELYCQWGASLSERKQTAAQMAKRMHRETLFLEDGFIRSEKLGLSGAATLSIILDDLGLYYDATRPTRMETLLEAGEPLTSTETERARAAITLLTESRVSKYNDAPHHMNDVGRAGVPKVLIIDQRVGDASLRFGLANEASFERMLADALQQHPDKDILIKRHPDALRGGKSSHYASSAAGSRVYLLDFDINPYTLLRKVDVVYVATSGMGFEALMAGKAVHCYGLPFYAGWGLTRDKVTTPRRTRKRSIEDIFHTAYIHLSRYYHPKLERRCQVEELIAHLKSHQQ